MSETEQDQTDENRAENPTQITAEPGIKPGPSVDEALGRSSQPIEGLSAAAVVAQRSAGRGNDVVLRSSRPYWQILRENLFTFINFVFLAIGVVLIGLGRTDDAFLTIVVILGGVVVNVIQEIAAKRKLDQIALLTRPKAIVIRDGGEQEIDPSEIVQGDLLTLRAGDQILVDGTIVAGQRVVGQLRTGEAIAAVFGRSELEVDESLLTGESDPILKQVGSSVLSGTVCLSGNAVYVAEKVGRESLAHRLTESARAFRQIETPLQQEINLVIRIFMLTACFLWALVAIALIGHVILFPDGVQRAAVIAGLVPSGLYLTITLSYALAAVRMVGKRVLIQQANAVESLSNVDVLCVDKTGTLTANRIQLDRLIPLQASETELRSLLGHYAASASTTNATSEAIAAVLPADRLPTLAEIPFSSARKWSAIALDWPGQVSAGLDQPGSGSGSGSSLGPAWYVLGAPEMLAPNLAEPLPATAIDQMAASRQQGLRVLLLARGTWSGAGVDRRNPRLPSDLQALAVLTFRDELRPQVRETLAGFLDAGIALKVISGDNPETVAALASQVGLGENLRAISGPELAAMDDQDFDRAAQEGTIFGRIAPDQKARLVATLRRSGQYVAMIGDGVNDVLSLKQANLGIAMESGSKATRSAADIVLLGDSFETLPYTFLEGQRIRNSIRDVLKLFMVRVFCVTLLIFSTGQVVGTFPLLNKHSAVVTLLAVGLPTFGFPLWAKPGKSRQKSVLKSMLHFTIPATLSLTLVALAVYLFYFVLTIQGNVDQNQDFVVLNDAILSVPRSALVNVLVLCGLMLVPFLKPPIAAWVGGEPLSGDWRYSLLALGLAGVYGAIVATPAARNFFELALLSPEDYAGLGLVVLLWSIVLRSLWRSRLLDRFLGVSLSDFDQP